MAPQFLSSENQFSFVVLRSNSFPDLSVQRGRSWVGQKRFAPGKLPKGNKLLCCFADFFSAHSLALSPVLAVFQVFFFQRELTKITS
jgi:hypothetical protein